MPTDQYRAAWGSYRESLSQIYQDDVQGLIATSSPTDAEALDEGTLDGALESSEALTASIVARIEQDDPEDRQLAMMQLAAGAAIDLGIAADLARQEPELSGGGGFGDGGMAAQAAPELAAEELVDSLSFVIPEAEPVLAAESFAEIPGVEPTADGGPPPSSANAEAVVKALEKAVAEIRDDAAETGKKVVVGVTGMGAGLTNALTEIGKDLIGGALEGLRMIIKRIVKFVLSAIEKLLHLLGPKVSAAITDKLKEWLKDLKEGDLVGKILTAVWQSKEIEEESKGDAQGAGDKLTDERTKQAIDQLKALSARYDKQSGLVRKVVSVVNFLAPKLAGVSKEAAAIAVAGYGAAMTYVVLSGGDYVDWYRLGENNVFDRVEGVRRIVRTATV